MVRLEGVVEAHEHCRLLLDDRVDRRLADEEVVGSGGRGSTQDISASARSIGKSPSVTGVRPSKSTDCR
jgi:hypothetical protein